MQAGVAHIPPFVGVSKLATPKKLVQPTIALARLFTSAEAGETRGTLHQGVLRWSVSPLSPMAANFPHHLGGTLSRTALLAPGQGWWRPAVGRYGWSASWREPRGLTKWKSFGSPMFCR